MRAGDREDAGYSLVELSVTLAVVGLMAALAIPAFKGIMPRVRLGNSATILMNEIDLMRREAIAKGVDFQVVFDTAAESYVLRKWNEASNTWQGMGTNKLTETDIVSFSGFATADTLVAQAGGTMNVPLTVGGNVNFGYITLQTPDGSRKKRLKVEQIGRVTVQRWVGGTSWIDE